MTRRYAVAVTDDSARGDARGRAWPGAPRYTGWWIYILGPLAGAIIAVAVIGVVRGLPNKQEREAAQGGALRMQDTSAPAASQQETS